MYICYFLKIKNIYIVKYNMGPMGEQYSSWVLSNNKKSRVSSEYLEQTIKTILDEHMRMLYLHNMQWYTTRVRTILRRKYVEFTKENSILIVNLLFFPPAKNSTIISRITILLLFYCIKHYYRAIDNNKVNKLFW